MRTTAIVLIVIATVEAAWGAAAIALGTRGWPRNPAGRMILLLLTSMFLLLSMSVWGIFIAPVPLGLRVAGMVGIVVALGWLIGLIYRPAVKQQLRVARDRTVR